MSKKFHQNFNWAGAALGVVASLALVGCAQKSPPAAGDAAAPTAGVDPALAERERALQEREAALAAKEQEQVAAAEAEAKAKADADAAVLAKAEQDKAAADAKRAASDKAAAAKKAEHDRAAKQAADKNAAAAKAAAAEAAKPIVVPAGTQLPISLVQQLSSKTAKVGDAFEALVTSDVSAGGRVAVPSGTRLTGTITHVVSGSQAIGAVPMLGLKFDNLVLANGTRVPISGELSEQGASEKGRDTAKILGGAAAGAVLGHQVKHGDTGKVVGGILGGAIGAVAAKKTGTEVTLTDGAPLTISVGAPFTVPGR